MLGCYPYPNDWEARWCAEHTCGWEPMTYSSAAENAEVLVAALDILSAATGAEFKMGEFGIPTSFESGVPEACEGKACGCTVITYRVSSMELLSQAIHVSSDAVRCGDTVRTLAHEIMHSIVPDMELHAKDGLFAEHSSKDMRLRGESLDILCAAMVCPARVDEL